MFLLGHLDNQPNLSFVFALPYMGLLVMVQVFFPQHYPTMECLVFSWILFCAWFLSDFFCSCVSLGSIDSLDTWVSGLYFHSISSLILSTWIGILVACFPYPWDAYCCWSHCFCTCLLLILISDFICYTKGFSSNVLVHLAKIVRRSSFTMSILSLACWWLNFYLIPFLSISFLMNRD